MPLPVRPPRAVLIGRRSLVALLGAAMLLGGCAGERPSLGKATVGTASTSTPTSSTTASTTSAPVADRVLGVEDLLGYIATPQGTPQVRRSPDAAAEAVAIGPTTDAATARGWYEVVLPTRPNGATGWVPASSVTITKTPYRVFVDLGARTLRVDRDGDEVFTATVAIGTEENPTPTGASFVTELIRNQKPGGAYGPYAFGLALHSNTLSEFNGGPGQVGIHGTNNPGAIGQAVSHGCVRLRNEDIRAMVDLALPLGVPVFVT